MYLDEGFVCRDVCSVEPLKTIRLDKTFKINKLWRVNTSFNEYEQAFENWLVENHLQFVAVDQQKRRIFARNKIKSFDFFYIP